MANDTWQGVLFSDRESVELAHQSALADLSEEGLDMRLVREPCNLDRLIVVGSISPILGSRKFKGGRDSANESETIVSTIFSLM